MHLQQRMVRARGAGGEVIKTEEELMAEQEKALEAWIKKLVQTDPQLEEAYYSVPDESFVVHQLKEDMAMGELNIEEMNRKMETIGDQRSASGKVAAGHLH